MSQSLVRFVQKLTIDSKRRFTPCHGMKKNKITFPDHFAIHLELKGIPLRNMKPIIPPKVTLWNTNKTDGWKKYKAETESKIRLDKITADNNDYSEKKMNCIDKELTKIKFKCFGKIKFRNEHNKNKTLDILQRKKLETTNEDELQNIDAKILNEIESCRKATLNHEISKLKEVNNVRGKIASVFKLKEIVTGKKKVIQEATVLFDPESNAEVTEVEAIKSLSLNHCKKLLTNRPPKSGYESDLQLKSVLHDYRMRDSIPEEEFELSYEMFNAALMRLKVKHASKFSFILKGGKSLICSIFSLCLTV